MSKKWYSPEERANYHKARFLSSKSVTERNKSAQWLDGYNDEHYAHNIPAVEQEIASKKGNKASKSYVKNILYPYLHGLKAQRQKQKIK